MAVHRYDLIIIMMRYTDKKSRNVSFTVATAVGKGMRENMAKTSVFDLVYSE